MQYARPQLPWHASAVSDVFEATQSGQSGLSQEVVKNRLAEVGLNELPTQERDPAWKLFVRQFQSPLMYLMFLAVVVSFFIGGNTDTFFILAVLLSNAIIGFYQERKANNSLQALKRVIKLKTRVFRDGFEKEIAVSELVPGDVVVLRAGDRVPADGRLFDASHLRVNEASLTGESKLVEKQVAPVKEDAVTADRTSMLFMGTIIEDGSARMVVVETGIHTQYGDVVRLLQQTKEEATPLQRTIMSLSKIIGAFITLIVLLLFIEGYLSGKLVADIFSVALALFVSAIPEGLLPAITIVLAIGMHRILKHNGLVRRLAATETLGGVTVICSDKTGTLTEGNMEVVQVLTADGVVKVQDKTLTQMARVAVEAAVFASDAYIDTASDATLIIRGRPTEKAFIKAGLALGVDKRYLEAANPALGTVFFSSERKYSASARTVAGVRTLYAVGAPDVLSEHITALKTAEGLVDRTHPAFVQLLEQANALVAEGFRLVASVGKTLPAGADMNALESEASSLYLIGFLVLSDPIRQEVPGAIAQTREAGIKTVLITGDHKQTALAVAKGVGITISPEQILEGKDIEQMSDAVLDEKVRTTMLYARVSPRHKLRIVKAYQKQGETVAMFGDGVNDAPALKVADIGVAVNPNIDAAREVADVVLLDSGFSTIVRAIEEGRIIFNNIRRVFLYLMVQDFSQFFIFFISIALGLPLPLLAAQLLFVNLVESGLPDLALTTENEREGIMQEPPRKRADGRIVTRRVLQWMLFVFVVSGTIAMSLYYMILSFADLQTARTMLTVLLCLESLFLALSLRSFKKSIFRTDLFSNKWITGAVAISFAMILVAVYLPPFQGLLELVPLTGTQWAIVVGANVFEIIVIDMFKTAFLQNRREVDGTTQGMLTPLRA